MEEAEGAGGVQPVGGVDRRHAEVVALDLHRRRQPGDPRLAVELRQARRQPPMNPDPGGQRDEDDQDGERQQRAQHGTSPAAGPVEGAAAAADIG